MSLALLVLRPKLVLLLTDVLQSCLSASLSASASPCLRDTASFILPRYRKSRGTSHYLSIYLSIYLSRFIIYLCLSLSLSLSIYQSISVSSLSIYLSINLCSSLPLSLSLSLYLSIYLSMSLETKKLNLIFWLEFVIGNKFSFGPVGAGCKIHWLDLCREISPPPLTCVLDMILNNLMVRLH